MWQGVDKLILAQFFHFIPLGDPLCNSKCIKLSLNRLWQWVGVCYESVKEVINCQTQEDFHFAQTIRTQIQELTNQTKMSLAVNASLGDVIDNLVRGL